MGLFDFLTGSRKKVNLTPDKEYPHQGELFFTSPTASQGGYSLRDFAQKRIKGENTGFGEDFLSKATNPAIASREARFNEIEMPAINSQLSARGLARSAGPNLATDVITRAGQSKERDVNDLISQFYVLNERQKKADTSEGLQLAQNLQGEERGMLDNRAAASERLVGRTVDERNLRHDDQANAGKLLVNAVGASLGMPGLGGSPTTSQNSTDPMSMVRNILNPSSSKSNILGSYSDDEINKLIMERQFAQRMGMR